MHFASATILGAVSCVLFSGAAAAQSRNLVVVEQIGRNQVAASVPPSRPVVGPLSSPGAGVAASGDMVAACKRAQIGGSPPQGVDCGSLLRTTAGAAAPNTPEGTLLRLLGENATVTIAPTARTAFDADRIARQLANPGLNISDQEAAAIATQNPAPATAPR